MEIENLDLDSINEARRDSAAATLKVISHEELAALGETLFPTVDHPWREPYFHFLTENSGETVYAGDTGDGYRFLFSPGRRRGFWYRSGGTHGMGPMQERGLQALGEIFAENKGRFPKV